MNYKIYIVIIIFSLLLLLPVCVDTSSILTIISGIGCSGLAAAAMALLLEFTENKKAIARKKKIRVVYLAKLTDQLKMLVERILWFDERMNDSFDWSQQPSSYLTHGYMINAGKKYTETQLSLVDAKIKINALITKYNLDQQRIMTKEEKQKTQQMFLILGESSNYLLSEILSIYKDKIQLNYEDILTLNDVEDIYFKIISSITIMRRPDKNYGLAIKNIFCAYEKLLSINGINNTSITIGLNGSIHPDDL